MSGDARGGAFEPFFLPAAHGERFCIYHPAAGALRGAVLYLHPFGDEMNKSRRMAALQSRALAAQGFAVLQLDLFGCGDSSGDFGDARWEIWREDVALGARCLQARAGRSVTLWGLRLGALLALDAARLCDPAPRGFVLWQPVVSGEQFLTQFLRLRVAREMLSAGAATTGTQQLRAALRAGETLEIAGYDLAPAIAEAIEGAKLAELAPQGASVHWLEVVAPQPHDPQPNPAQPNLTLPPSGQRVADAWTRGGARFDVRCVQGEPFWNTPEITECPALIAATSEVFGAGWH